MRKQPFTQPLGRTNLLLMNVAGVLTDQTAMFATQSDVPGDQGFLTPTTDRDVVLVDVDGDGWLDVVTATSLGYFQPKHIGHPRVYRNLGASPGGAWLGLRFESARSPQVTSVVSGQPVNPRFTHVAAGDVTGDGLPDLYFGDHDSSYSATGAKEIPADDCTDRLWINDGFGFFQDESNFAVYGRVDSGTTSSQYAVGGVIADLNDDGARDLLRADLGVRANYNSAAGTGHFTPTHFAHGGATYALAAGDLNRDGRIDFVAPDDAVDMYQFNTGVDPQARVIWSPPSPFLFAAGGDDGLAGQAALADLDGDGWNDVIVADVDVDFPPADSPRYCHVYHSLGGTPGAFNVAHRHERELASTSMTAGWRGVKGMVGEDLRGTYDVAPFDVDNDGDVDLVFGRTAGISVWANQLDPVCQPSLGFGHPGTVLQSVCGGDLSSGSSALLRLKGAPGAGLALLAVSSSQQPTFIPELGAALVPFPLLALIPAATGSDGTLLLDVPGGNGPFSLYTQWVVADTTVPGGWALSNALKLDFLP